MRDEAEADCAPDLFRREALVHRYCKHWGRVSDTRIRAADRLTIGLGAAVAGGAVLVLDFAIGLKAVLS